MPVPPGWSSGSSLPRRHPKALLAANKIEGPWALRLERGISTDLDLYDARGLDTFASPLVARLRPAERHQRGASSSTTRILLCGSRPPTRCPRVDQGIGRDNDGVMGRSHRQRADPLHRHRHSRGTAIRCARLHRMAQSGGRCQFAAGLKFSATSPKSLVEETLSA